MDGSVPMGFKERGRGTLGAGLRSQALEERPAKAGLEERFAFVLMQISPSPCPLPQNWGERVTRSVNTISRKLIFD